MEHLIRIAFWIFALGACLPQGNPAPLINTVNWNIELFKKVECIDSTFYTPTDVKNECFITALDCTMAELEGTAMKECKDNKKRISQGLNVLDDVVSKLKKVKNQTMNNSADCNCHRWPESSFDVFVEAIKSLLEEINANV